ncbi:MAG TPA: transglycosylase SLT domain-containing protein [Rhodanobacteraceae bacterium]|nr:transglycosylase SLT domain-containing protein [Rhodanobacteraceae bacterium]
MSDPRSGIRLALTLAACALLGACAVEPAKPPPTPAVVIPYPEAPAPRLVPITPAVTHNEPWASVTQSFVMHDCAASPLIRAREATYTRSPARFERMLKQALPLMMYVRKQLDAAGIPGEFVMLPMLESRYDPSEPSHHGDAAGMWQLMPATARRHGVRISRHYDGRRDPVASTRAAVEMLKALDQRFGDWRLADMAYNAGPHAVHVALRKHPQPGSTAIPDIPVSHAARRHLAKLMALSCILREPEHFHVKLPQLPASGELEAVRVPADTRLHTAANMAAIPESKLRALNPGYRGTRIPADSSRALLLPVAAARSLAATLALDASESVAQVDSKPPQADPSENLPLPEEPVPPADDGAAGAASTQVTHHRVRKGESLWSIARHYHVSAGDLKRWNHLQGATIHPGEMLRTH